MHSSSISQERLILKPHQQHLTEVSTGMDKIKVGYMQGRQIKKSKEKNDLHLLAGDQFIKMSLHPKKESRDINN